MAIGVGGIGQQITQSYANFVAGLHPWLQTFVNIALIALLITLFFIFVYKLYHIICKKNLIELNLRQYNTSSHSGFKKFMGTILYFIEYLIIFPIFVTIWFTIFVIFVMLLAKALDLATVLTVSTIIIIVIRTTAYFKESLSKEIAKLLPFTMLVVAISEKEFFNFERVFSRASEIPLFFENILVYILIIVAIEIILRFFDLIVLLIRGEEPDDTPKDVPVPNKR